MKRNLEKASGNSGKKSEKPDSPPPAYKIKTGKRPPAAKTFPPGFVLFSEGQPGHELFLISEGEVIVTIGEKSDRVELARLGPGSFVGELSLMDHLPRSATVTSTKDTKALVTTEATFENMFKIMPLWLSSVVKIIAARLRETNHRIGASNLKNIDKGVTHFLLMIAAESCKHGGQKPLEFDYYAQLREILFITRLRREQAEQRLEIMVEKKLLQIYSKSGKKVLCIPKKETLELYLDFLSLQELGMSMPISNIGKEGRTLLNHILNFCENSNPHDKSGNIQYKLSVLEKTLQEANENFRKAILQVLIQNGFLTIKKQDKTGGNADIIINPNKIRKALDEFPQISRFERKSRIPQKSAYISARIEQRKKDKKDAKPGVVPRTQFERIFNHDEFLFKEGEKGAEMYVIRSGHVRILKSEGSSEVELAILGPGTVLGEMSLMDGEPRSATAQAVGELVVTFIDKTHLNAAMQKLPAWASTLIKSVVKKLRQANEKLYFDTLRNGISTVVRAVLHQAALMDQKESNSGEFPIQKILQDTAAISGVSRNDGIKILEYLGMLNLGSIITDDNGKLIFQCTDLHGLKLLFEYRNTMVSGKRNPADEISPTAAALAKVIVEACRTRGSRSKERYIVDARQVKLQLEQMKIVPPELDRKALQELQSFGLLTIETKSAQKSQGAAGHEIFHYNADQLPLMVRRLKWKPVFEKDIAAMLT